MYCVLPKTNEQRKNSDAWRGTYLFCWFLHLLLLFSPRFMPDVPDAERHTDNKKYIETAFGVLCNTPLLSNHTASWEMLVSKRPITEYNTEGNLTAHIPVI